MQVTQEPGSVGLWQIWDQLDALGSRISRTQWDPGSVGLCGIRDQLDALGSGLHWALWDPGSAGCSRIRAQLGSVGSGIGWVLSDLGSVGLCGIRDQLDALRSRIRDQSDPVRSGLSQTLLSGIRARWDPGGSGLGGIPWDRGPCPAVPQVLRSCTEFVEQHGVVDDIPDPNAIFPIPYSRSRSHIPNPIFPIPYSRSHIPDPIFPIPIPYSQSHIPNPIFPIPYSRSPRSAEFEAQRSPELARPVYLQDVHCVSSLCKAYCRELPNPLLTYQLYDKFADAVAIQMEARVSPRVPSSRDIEASGFNGTAAFMEVRVQSIVVEFILTHVEQLFGDAPLRGGDSPHHSLILGWGSRRFSRGPRMTFWGLQVGNSPRHSLILGWVSRGFPRGPRVTLSQLFGVGTHPVTP
ncbi:PREDICTED: uncharacterized protein LOC108448766 [Corvus brachyrhynchos]|uniref:uncharacterized protein LOC108448766 n=1 Tax=Corvus brachyrhynchos TaxID=85066 RepID=UPI00081657CE|nr:PREDICTED: uncharacterized protein LOC108448766 [Corvus brachyrhynchos]